MQSRNALRFFCFLVAAALAAEAPLTAAAQSVVDVQRQSAVVGETEIEGGGRARLIDLNRNVSAWYLLRVERPGRPGFYASLERPFVGAGRNATVVGLDPRGLVVQSGRDRALCPVFAPDSPLWSNGLPRFVPLCGGVLSLRTDGRAPAAQQGLGAPRFSDAQTVADGLRQRAARPTGPASPPPPIPRLAPNAAGKTMAVPHLGIELDGMPAPATVRVGEWFRATRADGVFFGSLRPGDVAQDILASYRDRVNPLEAAEANSSVTLVALDLSKFEAGWSHGISQPGVAWPAHERAPRGPGPGPDGFGSLSPLPATGLLNPIYLRDLAAVMVGGFQRRDGSFRAGPLREVNHGNPWGFVENGVVFSRLNPEIATFYVTSDGRLDMKTWQASDSQQLLPRIRFARQNNPPLVDGIDANGMSVPGRYVRDWGAGAWSGSAAGQKLTGRSGACLVERDGNRFLIHAYFFLTNPDGMARTFQALQCKYAMHLDMNSPGQGYFALLTGAWPDVRTEHPIREMQGRARSVSVDGRNVSLPRYVGGADESDFFYFVRK